MFWGLIMEPQRRYSQLVKKSFHISMAALDISNSDNEPTQVVCAYEGRNYLLCTLQKSSVNQCALDLTFETGTQVSFATNGKAHVHLTGYLMDDAYGFDDEEAEEEEEAVSEADESLQVTGKRTKKLENGPASKKSKTHLLLDSTIESDSDDSEVNLSDLMNQSSDEDGEEEEAEDEEESDDEDDGDEDDEVSSLSEDEKPQVKQNGVQRKTRQEKKQQNPAKTPPLNKSDSEKSDKGKKDNAKNDGKLPKKEKKTVEGGVVVEDLRVGNGSAAKSGNYLTVYYEGRLKSNNKVFDATNKGPGFKFRLGKREVIRGWDVGIQGMKVGGKRRISCPANMAYGAKGSPPVVPPNATLVFDVELKNAN